MINSLFQQGDFSVGSNTGDTHTKTSELSYDRAHLYQLRAKIEVPHINKSVLFYLVHNSSNSKFYKIWQNDC